MTLFAPVAVAQLLILLQFFTDMAEFTGAKERIALGKKGRKEEEKRRRAGIAEAIEDGLVVYLALSNYDAKLLARCISQEDGDEEAKEWEMAQIRRGAAGDGSNSAEQSKVLFFSILHVPNAHLKNMSSQRPQKKIYKPAPSTYSSELCRSKTDLLYLSTHRDAYPCLGLVCGTVKPGSYFAHHRSCLSYVVHDNASDREISARSKRNRTTRNYRSDGGPKSVVCCV